MSDNGGYAFPCPETDTQYGQYGMTLRDYFAAAALQGMLAHPCPLPKDTTKERLAVSCYICADAMLAAREAK
jgi:ribosomal protein L37AE/L43A